MKQINKKKINKILFSISVVIVAIGLISGFILSFMLKNGLDNFPDMYLDGANFTELIRFVGYISFPIVALYIIGACVILCLLFAAFMWGVYGIVCLIRKIIKEKKWIYFIILGAIIVIIIFINMVMHILNNPILEEGTIGSIAYDYNAEKGYTVYVKEDGNYVPYLVLTYNYNKTNNALCLRKNIIGGQKGYTLEYNGTIAKDKVYDSWLNMQRHQNYEQTDVDKYLTQEFVNKFESSFLNNICNTNLSFSEYSNGVYTNYEIDRKFFLLSLTELADRSDFDNKSKNKMVLKYFENESRSATNDVEVECIYWTRTSHYGFSAVGYGGGIITDVTTEAKYGIRPAFTIQNNIKVKEIYNQEINSNIYIFDI